MVTLKYKSCYQYGRIFYLTRAPLRRSIYWLIMLIKLGHQYRLSLADSKHYLLFGFGLIILESILIFRLAASWRVCILREIETKLLQLCLQHLWSRTFTTSMGEFRIHLHWNWGTRYDTLRNAEHQNTGYVNALLLHLIWYFLLVIHSWPSMNISFCSSVGPISSKM